MAIRVQKNPEDFGRCGCGRRDYCDGTHSLTEEKWLAIQAKERQRSTEYPNATEVGKKQSN